MTALAFTLWPLARSEDVRAATLFRDAWSGTPRLPAPRYLFVIALIAATLIALAGWFNGSWFLTLWTLGGIAGASAGMAQIIFVLFLILFAIAMVARAVRGKPPV